MLAGGSMGGDTHRPGQVEIDLLINSMEDLRYLRIETQPNTPFSINPSGDRWIS